MKNKQTFKKAMFTTMLSILTTLSSWASTSSFETVPCGGSSFYALGTGCFGAWTVNLPDGTFYTATAHSITVDWGTTTGTGSVFVTIDCDGLGTTTETITVNVVAPRLNRPLLSVPNHVCNNETFTVSIPPVDGATDYTYTVPTGWQINGEIMTSLTTEATSITVTSSMYSAGSGLIKARANGGTCSMDSHNAVRTISYGALSPTILGPSSADLGDLVTFVATYYPYTDIEWSYPDAWAFGTPENHILHAMADGSTGTYPVTFNANLCGIPVSAFRTITIYEGENPGGGVIVPAFTRGAISDNSGQIETPVEITTYPNPSQGVFDVLVEHNELPFEINVYDQLGQVVYHSTEENQQVSLDLQHLPKGIYILQVSNSTLNQTVKLSLVD